MRVRMPALRSLVAAAAVLASVAAGSATAQPVPSPDGAGPGARATGVPRPGEDRAPTSQRVCPDTNDPDQAICMAMIRTDLPATRSLPPGRLPAGLSPQDIRSAYELPRRGGAGRRVAIVVAYDHPTAEEDLAVYRRTFHLPPCTTANKCFQKVYSTGVKPATVEPD